MALPKQSDNIIRDDDDEFEENNSISEHISVDSNVESDSGQLNVNIKKRQLFGMDTSDSFKDDDLLNDMLTGENIAKHFVIEDKVKSEILENKREEGDVDKSSDVKPSISVQQEQLVESISKLKDLSEKKIQIKIRKDDDDSKVESLNVKLDVRERSSKIDLMKSPSQKEISPLQEDVILINNEKVSIDSLKNLIQDDHSFNTTNDVSDIGADDNSLSGLLSEGKQELIKDNNAEDIVVTAGAEPSNDPIKSDDSFEEDHSIEEIVVSNASYNLDSDSKIKLQELQPSELLHQAHTYDAEDVVDSNVKKILDQTIDDLPSEMFENKNDPDSLDSLSAEMDRILRDTVDDLPANIFEDNPKFDQNSNINVPVNDPDSLENVSDKIHNILSDTINQLPIGMEESAYSKGSQSNDFIKEEISAILTKTVNELPITEPDSLEYSDDGIIDIKEKIKEKLQSNEPVKTKTHQQILEEIEIEDSPPVVVKSMEKCNYVKEMLDDITEESDMSLEPKVANTPATTSQIQEKGSEIRKILETNYKTDIIFPVSPYLADFAQNEQQANSFDSVVSLNMLQMLENKVKELEEIVAGKDVCLAALNMQLDSRRNSIKDILPSARDSYSLATVSTEYRTYQDEYVNRVSYDNFLC